MNILPHKSWHVRTRKNITRVRKDQEQAAEEERETQRRINVAEQESRIAILRQKSKISTVTKADEKQEHINFFASLEEEGSICCKKNKDHEKEKKEEQEKYEKQIGYLTYLGQDTNEALGKRNWYDVPKKIEQFDERGHKIEVGIKSKSLNDPLNVIKKYLSKPSASRSVEAGPSKYLSGTIQKEERPYSKKRKRRRSESPHKQEEKRAHKHKKRKRECQVYSESEEEDRQAAQLKKLKLERLRAERLKREQEEKLKTEMFLAKLNGATTPVVEKRKEELHVVPLLRRQKYNSQFNPELAKQNYD